MAASRRWRRRAVAAAGGGAGRGPQWPGPSRARALRRVALPVRMRQPGCRPGGTESTLPGAAGAASAACVMHSSAMATRPANSLDMSKSPNARDNDLASHPPAALHRHNDRSARPPLLGQAEGAIAIEQSPRINPEPGRRPPLLRGHIRRCARGLGRGRRHIDGSRRHHAKHRRNRHPTHASPQRHAATLPHHGRGVNGLRLGLRGRTGQCFPHEQSA